MTSHPFYTLQVNPTGAACDATAINQCCGMAVEALQLTLASSANVVSTRLNGALLCGTAVQFAPLLAPASSKSPATGLQTMTISQLGMANGMTTPSVIVVTVKLPTGTNLVPDICSAGSPSTATVGGCAYAVLPPASTSASLCCPASKTVAVAPTKPGGGGSSGTCSPSITVPIQSTTMGFNYYEGPVAASTSSTKFTFMVYNNATCTGKHYCEDVCNWQLFVNPALAPLLSFVAEDGTPESNSLHIVASGPNASVTFLNTPAEGGTVMYTLVVAQAGVTLAQLCNGNALPGIQNGASCAAVIRNPSVFSTVLFSESDVVMPPNNGNSSPPPSTLPVSCSTSAAPLSGSCIRVVNATYNNPLGPSNAPPTSTVMDFNVQNYGSSAPGGCTPDSAVMTFQVLLQANVAAQLQARNSIVPSTADFARSVLLQPHTCTLLLSTLCTCCHDSFSLYTDSLTLVPLQQSR